jgi:drug/metabolite transporter (DMT)-like permease
MSTMVTDRQARAHAWVHGVGIILVASVLVGAMAVCVRVASRAMPAVQIALIRFAGSLLVLIALTRGRGLRPQAASLPRLVLRGLLGAGAIVFYYSGIRAAGAGFATLMQSTYPVFTALFAVGLLDESFDRSLALALVLNVIGVAIVLGVGARVQPGIALGGLWALGGAVLSGGAVTTARYLRSTENAALITTYFMIVGLTVTAPGLLMGFPALSGPLVAALAGVVITSVAGQWLLHHGLGFTTATQGSLAAVTSVLSATLLEALTLGQRPPARAVVGAGFMVAAVSLSLRRR